MCWRISGTGKSIVADSVIQKGCAGRIYFGTMNFLRSGVVYIMMAINFYRYIFSVDRVLM
jgi:hypothetical protein